MVLLGGGFRFRLVLEFLPYGVREGHFAGGEAFENWPGLGVRANFIAADTKGCGLSGPIADLSQPHLQDMEEIYRNLIMAGDDRNIEVGCAFCVASSLDMRNSSSASRS